jgi:tetratricopeptide (TPR) repeat protein
MISKSLRPHFAIALTLATIVAGAACRRDAVALTKHFIEEGDRYSAQQRYREAVVEYRNALEHAPRQGDIRVKLAEAYLKVGDAPAALKEYVHAADLLPGSTDVLLKAGNLLLLAGRFDDAKGLADKVIAAAPDTVDGRILAANALGGLKHFADAVAQIEDALRMDPNHSGTYSNLGALELRRGNRDAAEAAFKQAVALAPASVAAHLSLANFYWSGGKWPEAEAELKESGRLEPDNILALRVTANFFVATNRPQLAEPPLQRLVTLTNSVEATFTLADYYAMTGSEAKARALLEPLAQSGADMMAASVKLATLDHASGAKGTAYARLQRALTADPKHLQALIVEATLYLHDGRAEDAYKTASVAAAAHPDSTAALFALARTQAARNRPDEAVLAYQRVLELNPRATDAKVALAKLKLAEGRPDASMTFAQEALSHQPTNGEARLVLVRALFARGDIDSAARELDRLVTAYPDSAAVHAQLGFLHGRKNNISSARREFLRAKELDPDSLEALAGLVGLEVSQKNFSAAIKLVEERLQEASPRANLFMLAARTYTAAGDLSRAEQYLAKAVEIDPNELAAYAALGQLYAKQGRLDAARIEFEQIVERSPRSVPALTMLGIIHEAQGDPAGARRAYQRALDADASTPVAANNLAWLLAERNEELDLALQLAQTAQRRLAEVAEVNDTLGFVYLQKNIAPLAVSTLKASVEKQPTNPLFHYHLGLAYAKAGDDHAARQHLSRALALKPDFPGAAAARNLLNDLGSH